MEKDRNYLINFYNATSTDDGTGEIETYEAWLERQLLSRIERIEELEKDIEVKKTVSGIGIIGHVCHSNVSVIEALVKAVEKKTGETVICVNVNPQDIEALKHPILPKQAPIILQSIDHSYTAPEVKRKGHERPYKYHR